jgi:hypothetical protein
MADVLVGRRAALSALTNLALQKSASWNEAQHPRIPGRHRHGGRFTRRGGGLPSDLGDEIKAHGGATVDPRSSSYIIHGTVVATGINSQLVDATRFHADSAWAEEQVFAYLKTNKATIADNPDHHLGFWFDEANGEICFDVVEVTDRANAVRLGRERGEQAVWDLDAGEEVPTGGSGGRETLEVVKNAHRRGEPSDPGDGRRGAESPGEGDSGDGEPASSEAGESPFTLEQQAVLNAVANYIVQKSLRHWAEALHPRRPRGSKGGGQWTRGAGSPLSSRREQLGWTDANVASRTPSPTRSQRHASVHEAVSSAQVAVGDPNDITGTVSKIEAYPFHHDRYLIAGNAMIEAGKGNLQPLRDIVNWDWAPYEHDSEEQKFRVGWWQMHPRQRQQWIDELQKFTDDPKAPVDFGSRTPQKAGFLGESWLDIPEKLGRIPDFASDGGPTGSTLAKVDAVKAAGSAIAAEIDARMGNTRAEIEAHVAPIKARAIELTRQIGESTGREEELHDEWQEFKDARRAEGYEGKSIDLPQFPAFRASIKALHEDQNRIIEERRVLDKQIEAHRTSWSAQQRLMTQEVLESIRPLNTAPLTLNYGGARGVDERAELKNAMNWAATNYPADWIALSEAEVGKLTVDLRTRGSYAKVGGRATVYLSTNDPGPSDLPSRSRVAVHELGHRMEDVVPGLKALEWAYHWQRTSTPTKSKTAKHPRIRKGTNALVDMPGYNHEQARADEFKLMYSGKVYNDKPDEFWELFTTSAESIFAGSDYNDPDLRAFTLGAMATLGYRSKSTVASGSSTSSGSSRIT